jgi:DNA-binding transcriptional MerR regulator
MLGLAELKQTKVYQEAKEEGKQQGKLETIPRLLELGLSLQAIPEALDLPLELVQPVAELFYQQNITAFIELLKNQRSLFSAEDLAELAGLIAPLPDQIEDLSSAISLWCKQEQRSAQRNALKQVRQTLSSDTLIGEVNSSELAINKQMLLESIELRELDN